MKLAEVTLDIANEASGVLPYATETPTVGFGNFLQTILSAVFVIAALIVFLYLIWGAIEWISAGGDSGKIQKARDGIIQSIIGLIVLSAMVVIFVVVQEIFGITIINFTSSKYPDTGIYPATGVRTDQMQGVSLDSEVPSKTGTRGPGNQGGIPLFSN